MRQVYVITNCGGGNHRNEVGVERVMLRAKGVSSSALLSYGSVNEVTNKVSRMLFTAKPSEAMTFNRRADAEAFCQALIKLIGWYDSRVQMLDLDATGGNRIVRVV